VLRLHDLGDVPVDNVLHVADAGSGPRVVFTSSTVFPGLVAGQRVVRTATVLRAKLVDEAGRALRGVDRDLDVNVLGPVSADGHGTGGLELALDGQLRGPTVTQIQVVNATTGALVRAVATFGSGHAPPDVATTLSPQIQQAAEAALTRVAGPAALVAIDTRTGSVRAVANKPLTGFPSALRGSYAPGSTFKTVTALAALMNGFTPSSQLDCPATVTAGGKQFRNHEPGSRGRISLLTAYAQSCNTAFVNLSQSLPKGSVTAAARLLGFDAAGPLLPIPSVGGTLPPPRDTAEAAADAIGQGRVEASPLMMASVAAAVADGMWRQPRLTSCPDCTGHALTPAAVAGLRQLMRAVVTSGTGSALASFTAPPASAKTGTAEFGAGTPPPTHAWMIGYRGQLAFAVYVESGESGGRTAGPVAAAFLRAV
jgi:cell division protein FtsI/penicillin-binding protein 2